MRRPPNLSIAHHHTFDAATSERQDRLKNTGPENDGLFAITLINLYTAEVLLKRTVIATNVI